MISPLSAIILAGGRARRLGGSKAERLLDGRRLVDRVADSARVLSDDVMLLPRDRSLVVSAVRLVADMPDVRGPLGGLAAGLAAARHPWSWLLPCDMPGARATVARRLAAAAADHRPAPWAVVLTRDGRRQPFHALYHRDVRPELAAWISAGGRSLMGLLDRCAVAGRLVELPLALLQSEGVLGPEGLVEAGASPDEPSRSVGAFLDDVDTPADLSRLEARWASRHGSTRSSSPRALLSGTQIQSPADVRDSR